jgi:hypothetical protein
MKDNIKPSILLSGFVSTFKDNDEIIYLITYHSNGKFISDVKDTFDTTSMIQAIQLNTNIDEDSFVNYTVNHIKHSNRIESMDQVESLKNNYKLLILALVGYESELYFSNFDVIKRINIANYYGAVSYTHRKLDGSVEYLSVDDYEKTILNEQGN